MLYNVLVWGLVAGIGHFVFIGLLYGNPFVAKQYDEAMKTQPSVRNWPSPGKYRLIQFLGTQVEVFILALSYFLFRPAMNDSGWSSVMVLGAVLALVRVYPRFWNMWIQTTYPRNLLLIEIINGTLGTFAILAILEAVHG